MTVAPGVGIGIVDLGTERRLANHLGAHRAPSILGLLNGRVTFFHQAIVREYLRQFIEDLLPTKLVEKVNGTYWNTASHPVARGLYCYQWYRYYWGCSD